MSSHHIAACIYTGTGHVRPTLALATHLVHVYPSITFTAIVHRDYARGALEEIKLSRIPHSAAQRIRVVGISDEKPTPSTTTLLGACGEMTRAFPDAYRAIAGGGSITCTCTGKTFNFKGIPSPRLFLEDILLVENGPTIREITPNAKVLVHWIGTVNSILRSCLPKELGGLVEWEEETTALMAADSTLTFGAASTRLRLGEEPWINAEELPLYQYELLPQEMPAVEGVNKAHMQAIREINNQGIVFSAPANFEPRASKAAKEWFGRRQKGIFHVGAWGSAPMLRLMGPSSEGRAQNPRLFDFLDEQAEKSVWLIAFGTIFYPYLHPEHVYAMIEALIHSRTPFILSRASAMSKISPLPVGFEEKVNNSGIGLICPSVPQQDVLLHPSLAAFVTHGGVNSMFECVLARVVPVFWPFAADQPIHASYLTNIKDCAFELIQVRTGTGIKPLLRGHKVVGTQQAIFDEVRQVVTDLKSAVGARKRANLEVVRQSFVDDHAKGGSVDQSTLELLRYAFGPDCEV